MQMNLSTEVVETEISMQKFGMETERISLADHLNHMVIPAITNMTITDILNTENS